LLNGQTLREQSPQKGIPVLGQLAYPLFLGRSTRFLPRFLISAKDKTRRKKDSLRLFDENRLE
jgi:hypothetical protein